MSSRVATIALLMALVGARVARADPGDPTGEGDGKSVLVEHVVKARSGSITLSIHESTASYPRVFLQVNGADLRLLGVTVVFADGKRAKVSVAGQGERTVVELPNTRDLRKVIVRFDRHGRTPAQLQVVGQMDVDDGDVR